MQNLVSIWLALDFRKKAVVVGATLAMFLAVLGLARMAGSPQMVLLYAGLESSAAGQIVAALDQRGVAHEVRGDAIYVDSRDRDSLRMALAAEGMPAAGGGGYELLDGLTGFGTTSQMFDAAYWRAKEGELARTILAVPEIKTARVHIAQTLQGPFRKEERPTASVTVTTSTGSLTPEQAQALRHLVASAIAGMRPDDVQVIDAVGGLIPSSQDGKQGPRSGSSRRDQAERGTPAGGPGRTRQGRCRGFGRPHHRKRTGDRAEVRSARSGRDLIRDRGTQRKLHPARGDVTVASNLPEGDAASGSNGQAQASETRERVNYEVSETQRELLREPGGIRRLTVAVLIDGETVVAQTARPAGRREATRNWQSCGNSWLPQSALMKRAAMS